LNLVGGPRVRRRHTDVCVMIGEALAHLCPSLPGPRLYLTIRRVCGSSTLGRVLDLFLIAVFFVLSVSFLARFVGA